MQKSGAFAVALKMSVAYCFTFATLATADTRVPDDNTQCWDSQKRAYLPIGTPCSRLEYLAGDGHLYLYDSLDQACSQTPGPPNGAIFDINAAPYGPCSKTSSCQQAWTGQVICTLNSCNDLDGDKHIACKSNDCVDSSYCRDPVKFAAHPECLYFRCDMGDCNDNDPNVGMYGKFENQNILFGSVGLDASYVSQRSNEAGVRLTAPDMSIRDSLALTIKVNTCVMGPPTRDIFVRWFIDGSPIQKPDGTPYQHLFTLTRQARSPSSGWGTDTYVGNVGSFIPTGAPATVLDQVIAAIAKEQRLEYEVSAWPEEKALAASTLGKPLRILAPVSNLYRVAGSGYKKIVLTRIDRSTEDFSSFVNLIGGWKKAPSILTSEPFASQASTLSIYADYSPSDYQDLVIAVNQFYFQSDAPKIPLYKNSNMDAIFSIAFVNDKACQLIVDIMSGSFTSTAPKVGLACSDFSSLIGVSNFHSDFMALRYNPRDTSLSTYDIVNTVLHEFGHGLGGLTHEFGTDEVDPLVLRYNSQGSLVLANDYFSWAAGSPFEAVFPNCGFKSYLPFWQKYATDAVTQFGCGDHYTIQMAGSTELPRIARPSLAPSLMTYNKSSSRFNVIGCAGVLAGLKGGKPDQYYDTCMTLSNTIKPGE